MNPNKARRRKFVKDALQEDPRCFYCLLALCEETATVDHYIPLAKGGKDHERNFRLCCWHCNHEKGVSHPREFIEKVKWLMRIKAPRYGRHMPKAPVVQLAESHETREVQRNG